jgi:hypothetical protein
LENTLGKRDGAESTLSERGLKGTLNDKDKARKHIIRYARARKHTQNEK